MEAREAAVEAREAAVTAREDCVLRREAALAADILSVRSVRDDVNADKTTLAELSVKLVFLHDKLREFEVTLLKQRDVRSEM